MKRKYNRGNNTRHSVTRKLDAIGMMELCEMVNSKNVVSVAKDLGISRQALSQYFEKRGVRKIFVLPENVA